MAASKFPRATYGTPNIWDSPQNPVTLHYEVETLSMKCVPVSEHQILIVLIKIPCLIN